MAEQVRYTQEGRELVLETPLGPDVLLLTSFAGQEVLSGLFRYRLEMLSESDSITPRDIVGKNVTVSVELPDNTERYFNGYVSDFSYLGTGSRLSRYTMEVVPWLWFLTLTANCRIFQEKTAIQIVEQVFADLGFSDFETSEVKGNHRTRGYCVQYRESDFGFVSRLLEEEGIFYYFRHENGKHTLVLADQTGAYRDCAEKEVEFAAPEGAPQSTDLITRWEHQYAYRPGKWTQTDYNFETPTANLMAQTSTVVDLENISTFEKYDYPGKYTDKGEGESLVQVRIEQEEVSYDRVHGASVCRSFAPGGTFTLTKHRSPGEQGKGYVLVEVEHRASQEGAYIVGGELEETEYSNAFVCIPDSVTFRPARATRKPFVRGSQTAVVVGPSGEEIHTDKHGRVKVQFHWDRQGKADEKSSCWVRVAQSVAGKKWGRLFIPRIGQEVVVDFLEGDPDRPIITGCVYNATCTPPYDLPANKTISTLKSNSSKGGGGFNEIRFEDKKGDEQVFIHAEKNLDIRVKNDRFETVKKDRHLHVEQDKVEHVDNNRHEKVDADHVEEIGKDRHLKVAGKEAREVGQSLSLTVKGDVIEVFKANHSEQTTQNYYVKATGVVIEAMQGITLKCGGSSVVVDPTGVTVKGAMVTVDGAMTKINSGPGSPPAAGQAGSAVAPTAVNLAEDADEADPGEVAQVKAEQTKTKAGKYGATPIKPHKPPQTEEQKEQKQSWVEIVLRDDEGNPVPGEAYKVVLPDGETVAEGTLDEKGFARVDGIEPGQCEVLFPNLENDQWDKG